MKTLDKAEVGFEGTIKEIDGDPTLVERLREIGCARGETIKVVSRLVFGEPIIVEVAGTSVALRILEAGCIQV